MINALFIISPRGDCILQRALRNRQDKNIGEVFLKHVKKPGASGPVIVIEECDTTFTYAQHGGLYFVFSMASVDMPLSVCCDLLESLVTVVKDLCGVLTEENLRSNFLLLNEVVDEMFDYGIPVAHDTQQLTVALGANGSMSARGKSGGVFGSKEYVLSDSWAKDVFSSETVSKLTSSLGLTLGQMNTSSQGPKTLPSQASQMPVGRNGAAEIFVDIKDRVSAEISLKDGSLLRGGLDGYIVVKSYMDDYPALKVGLSSELVLDNPLLCTDEEQQNVRTRPRGPALVLDDCVFDDSVDSSELSSQKCLTFTPKKGEFVLMRYRAQNFALPFDVKAHCEVIENKIELRVHVTSHATRDINGIVSINFALPRWAGQCHVALFGDQALSRKNQKAAVNPSDKSVTWVTRCVEVGDTVMGFGVKFEVRKDNYAPPAPIERLMNRGDGDSIAQYLAPLRLNFDLPMYSSSKLQIKYIRCCNDVQPPQRWVRYVTQSDSFTASFIQ